LAELSRSARAALDFRGEQPGQFDTRASRTLKRCRRSRFLEIERAARAIRLSLSRPH
jgi:hypothetical protein